MRDIIPAEFIDIFLKKNAIKKGLLLGKKGWIFCSIAFCVQAVLLVTANLWYMYAVLHVHLPGEILLSEDVWNEALSGKVYICDEQKMTYLGFTTKIIREFIWGGLSIYYVNGSTFSSKRIPRNMVTRDTQNRYLPLDDGAYLYNGHWRLQHRAGLLFPAYVYSAYIGYQKEYM